MNSSGSGQEPVEGCFEEVIGLGGSIKDREFFLLAE
jgi:hypothetical protein